MADADAPIMKIDSAEPARAHPGRAIGTPLASVIAVLTTIIGLIVLAWAVLYVTKGRFLKHPFEHVVGDLTHRQVKVAGDFQFYFDPIALKLRADGMTFSNPEWAGTTDFFSADKLDARIATFPSLFGKRLINWLDLQNGHVDLQWDKAHKTNTWTFGEAGKAGRALDQRGKRRLHSKPNAGEIAACRWWFEHETTLIRPQVTVAMGATAARSVFGRAMTISRARGQAHELADGGTGWVTVHPSFLLRMPDRMRAEEEFDKFVADLKAASKLIRG